MTDRRTKVRKIAISGRRATDATPTLVLNHQIIADEIKQQLEIFTRKFDQYVENDMTWKVRAEPMLQAYENTGWAIRVLVSVVKITGVLATAFGAVVGSWFAFKRFLH